MSLLAAALGLALLPVEVAGSAASARLQLDAGAEVQPLTIAGDPGPVAPLVSLALTVFPRRVVDDATPLPLQPFLQRSGAITLRARGALHGGRALGADVELAADVYARPWLALTAELGGAFAGPIEPGAPSPRELAPLRAAAGLGLRWGDLRLDLGFRYAPGRALGPLPEQATLRGGGAVVAGVRAVLVEHIDLSASVATSLAGDVIGRLAVDYHPARRLSLSWGLLFGHGVYTTATEAGTGAAPPAEDLFGGRFGLWFWWSPRIALGGSFSPAWHFLSGGQGSVEERLLLAVSSRL